MKESIRLRAMEPEDLDTLYRIENDIDVWNVGTTNVPYSRYALHDYLANASGDIYVDRQVRLIIENQANTIVGILDIVNFDPRHMRAEISIIIQRPYRNKGYATRAIRNALDYSKTIIHLHQLYAYIDVNNEPSLKTFQKAGFTSTIRLKDWLYNGETYQEALFMQYFL